MTEPLQNFSLTRNTDSVIPVAVLTNVPNDSLLGCFIEFNLYAQKFGIVQDDTPLITKNNDTGGGITVPPSPPTLMEFDVAFNRTELETLDYVNYYYEATVMDEIGNQVAVISGIVAITVGEN